MSVIDWLLVPGILAFVCWLLNSPDLRTDQEKEDSL